MPVDRTKVIALLKRCHLFRGIEDGRLEVVANMLTPVEVPTGSTVFNQGDDPTEFYFVYSGRLKVIRYSPRTHQTVQIGVLEQGDYFGQEVLAESWPRQVSMEAEDDVTVLSLTVPHFQAVLSEIPALSGRLQLALDSYRLMLSSRFPWLEAQEYVYYIARKHPYFLLLKLVIPFFFALITVPGFLLFARTLAIPTTTLVLVLLSAAITAVWFVLEYIDWANDYYMVTSRRVIFQEKVILLYDSRLESPLEAVQSTSTSSSQIGRWLGYGNVAVRTYIGVIYFRSIAQSDQVLGLIQEHQLRAQLNLRSTETRHIETLIKKSLGLLPPDPATDAKKPEPKKPSVVRQFLAEMFHLRMEQGGAVIYRTHWFILLKKILLPSLMLLGLLGLVVTSILNRFAVLSPAATFSLAFIVGMVLGVWWFYQYLDWHNDVYIISQDQVVDVYKKPLGVEQRDAAPVKNILSIEYKRLGILGLLLDYGTVYIRVGDKTLTFDEVQHPSKIQRELFDRVTAKTYQERQTAMESERQRNAEFLAVYHRVVDRHHPPQSTTSRGGF